jgi:hypothetical protein
VNPVSIGHITSLDAPQNGHLPPCGTSFTLLCGPEILNVFRHFVQVTIFSILNSLLLLSSTGLSRPSGQWRSRGPAQFQAFAARAFEISVFRNQYMAALLADEPGWPLQQRSEIIIQDAVRAANDLSHFERFAASPSAFVLLPRP